MPRITSQGPVDKIDEVRILEKPVREMTDEELERAITLMAGNRSMIQTSKSRAAGVRTSKPRDRIVKLDPSALS